MDPIKCKRCETINFYFEEKRGPHLTAICASCGSYIKHLGKNKPFVMPFGRFKGRKLSSLNSREEKNYLNWVLENLELKKVMKEKIINHLNQ